MAAEQMIQRTIAVGLLIAMCVMVGATGAIASEYEFAPPEALDMAQGLGPQQPFDAPGESQWNLSGVDDTAHGTPIGTCCAKCGGGMCCQPLWYWEENLRVLGRTRSRRIPLTLKEYDVPNNPYNPANPLEPVDARYTLIRMSNKTLSFNIAAGIDTTIGHYLGRDAENRDQFIEFTHWGLNSWDESRQVNGLRTTTDVGGGTTYTHGDLLSLFPSDVGAFDRADTHFAAYSSDINNFELNVRVRPRGRADRLVLKPSGVWQRECQPRTTLSYLLGFRYFSMDEFFAFRGRGAISTNGGAANATSGDYDIHTNNDLFGPQIGADLMFHRCRYSYGVQTKVAPLVNLSDQTSTIVTDVAGDPQATYGNINDYRYATKDDCSLIGEVSILGNYRVRRNLALHAGYHFIWITGLALASEQIQFQPNAAAAINVNGHAFYHGLSGGLEWIW